METCLQEAYWVIAFKDNVCERETAVGLEREKLSCSHNKGPSQSQWELWSWDGLSELSRIKECWPLCLHIDQ